METYVTCQTCLCPMSICTCHRNRSVYKGLGATKMGYRRNPGRPRLKLKPVSKDRRADDRIYRMVKAYSLRRLVDLCGRADGRSLMAPCTDCLTLHPAGDLEPHHVKGRIGTATDGLDFYWHPAYIVWLCNPCHGMRTASKTPKERKNQPLLEAFSFWRAEMLELARCVLAQLPTAHGTAPRYTRAQQAEAFLRVFKGMAN